MNLVKRSVKITMSLNVIPGVMLNILIEQMNSVQVTRDATIDNKPLRKHHEKIFTDVVS